MTKKIMACTVIVMIILPFIVLVLLSFGLSWAFPKILPDEISWRSIQTVFQSDPFLFGAARNSLLIATLSALFSLVIGIPCGKALALYNFKGKKFVELLVMVPLIVPPIAIISGLHFSMIKYHLDGTLLGSVLVHSLYCMPYVIPSVKSSYGLLNRKLQLAAENLGASRWQTFRWVTLPLLMPGIFAALSLSLSVSMCQYVSTLLIGGGKYLTLPVLLIPYTQTGKYHLAAIYGLLMVVLYLVPLKLCQGIFKFKRRRRTYGNNHSRTNEIL